MMTDVEAVVAGAGPAGTVAASLLAQKGVSVLLCEAGPTCAEDLRASTFHPPTVEMLDELDVAEPLIAIGLKAPVYTYRDRRTGETVSFDMAEIGDRTRYPFRLQCEQFHLSRMLAERLARHAKASVEFSHRVIGFQQDDDGVTVHIETPFAITHVRARYLVGADGGNSIVRKWLETEFEGFTLPEKFLCLSTEMPLERHLDNLSLVNYVSDPKEWLVLLRVPSVWRILVPAPENQTDEYLLSDDRADLLFRDLLGTDCKVKTRHRTIYRVHQRVATRFSVGRVFIIGDAAHLNNPLGGFGMNSGIHDAWSLCEKIKSVLDGGDEAQFELFDRQRRAVTHSFIQRQTIRNLELLRGDRETGARKMTAEMKAVQADPAKRQAFLLYQSMITSLEEAAKVA